MKTRHNFNKDLRMDLACSRNDYFRPVFSYIHFKDGYAYACDTHILVKNKLSECSTFTDEEIEKLDGKFIGSKASSLSSLTIWYKLRTWGLNVYCVTIKKLYTHSPKSINTLKWRM